MATASKSSKAAGAPKAAKMTTTKTAKAAPAKKVGSSLKTVAAGTHKVTGHLGGFVDFIRAQGVVGLAVGLALGTAAGDTVKKLVEGFINPIVQFIVGSNDGLASATWRFEAFGRSADFAWGAAVSSAITLVATALVIYWVVNIFKLDKLDKVDKKD